MAGCFTPARTMNKRIRRRSPDRELPPTDPANLNVI
jgi:hypothetical protein